MPCCVTGRNIQKYKGAGGTASTLQDALENDNVATIDIILQSPAKFVGDGSGLFGIPGVGGSVGNLQQVTDVNSTSTNKIILTNTATSLQTYGNIVVGTNVYASEYFGDGTKLSGIALNTELADNVIRIGNLETNLTNNSTRITTVTNNLTNNVIRIGNLETNLTNNSIRIGNLETNLTDNSTRITSVTNNLTNNVIRIGNLETNLTNNGIRIGNLETNLTNNSTRITTVTNNLTNNVIRIGNLETNLTSNSSRISTLETEIQPVNRGGTGLTSFVSGDLIYANGTSSFTNLAASSSTQGYFLKNDNGIPTWADVSLVGSASPYSITAGSGLSGGNYNGSSAVTWTVDFNVVATTSNLNSNVARIDTLENEIQPVNRGGTGLTSYTVGDLLYAVGPTTLSVLSAGNNGEVLTMSSGLPSWAVASGGSGGGYWTQSGSSIYYTNGNVGIGTTNPNYKLHVAGTSNFTNAIYANGSVGLSGQVLTSTGPGSAPTWTTVSGGGGGSSYWTQSGLNIYYTTGNVGISNTNPNHKLSVAGDIYTSSENGFIGYGGNISGISIQGERNNTIINFGIGSKTQSAYDNPD
jgi:hypothetical protein